MDPKIFGLLNVDARSHYFDHDFKPWNVNLVRTLPLDVSLLWVNQVMHIFRKSQVVGIIQAALYNLVIVWKWVGPANGLEPIHQEMLTLVNVLIHYLIFHQKVLGYLAIF